MNKTNLLKWINNRIEISERCLKINGTNYNEVMNNDDTSNYDDESENNNFEAGVISGLMGLKKELLI